MIFNKRLSYILFCVKKIMPVRPLQNPLKSNDSKLSNYRIDLTSQLDMTVNARMISVTPLFPFAPHAFVMMS
jgi:hypothetical protein